jgi:non-ribosomal peptide synthetase component F
VVTGEEDNYEDYIRYIDRTDRNKEEAYWRNYLKDIQHSTLLPFIGTTTERTKGSGANKSLAFQLDRATSLRIQNFAQQSRVTVNTLMQATWSYLLHQYTGHDHTAYGVVVSGGPDDFPGVERRVGLYINTLPLQASIKLDQPVIDWLQQLQAEQVASRRYQHTALNDIQRWTGVPGDLFDSLLVFENYPVSKVISSKTWSLQIEDVRVHDPTNYPITILINSSEQIKVSFYYNTSLLDEGYVKNILGHFEHVLLQLADGKLVR